MPKQPYTAKDATGRITPVTITPAGGPILSIAPNRVGLIFGAADGGAYSLTTDGPAAFGVGYTIETTSGVLELYREHVGHLTEMEFFAISKAGTLTCGVIEVFDPEPQ